MFLLARTENASAWAMAMARRVNGGQVKEDDNHPMRAPSLNEMLARAEQKHREDEEQVRAINADFLHIICTRSCPAKSSSQ